MHTENFKLALQFTLGKEGAYSDGNDGETFRGINRRFHAGWTGWVYVDRAKKANFPIEQLTENDVMQKSVAAFYYNKFWLPMKCDRFELPIAMALFDAGVNSGPGDAIAWMQKACNDIGDSLKVDGILGPKTEATINLYNPCHLLLSFHGHRLKKYYSLRHEMPRNLAGWMNRTADLMLYK